MVHTIYIVSESADRIEPVGEEMPSHYVSPELAGRAILDGHHGDYGRRFVLKVVMTTVAEYDRPWAMVRKDDQE